MFISEGEKSEREKSWSLPINDNGVNEVKGTRLPLCVREHCSALSLKLTKSSLQNKKGHNPPCRTVFAQLHNNLRHEQIKSMRGPLKQSVLWSAEGETLSAEDGNQR